MLDDLARLIGMIFQDTITEAGELTAAGLDANKSKDKWTRRLGKLSCFGAILIALTGLGTIAALIYLGYMLVRYLLGTL